MFTCGPAFYGALKKYPLDAYTTGLWSACAINRLLTSWTGALIQVRRSSDNALMDIGYTSGGVLDTATLASFVGASSGYVEKWYDQSGAGNDFAEFTLLQQPRIVNAGTYLGYVEFNTGFSGGVNGQRMTSVNAGGTTVSKSIFRKVNNLSFIAADNISWEYGDSSLIGAAGGNGQVQLDNASSVNGPGLAMAGNSSAAYYGNSYGSSATSNGTPECQVINRSKYPASSPFSFYRGSLLTGSAFSSGSPSFTGSFPAWNWSIGCRSAGTLPANIAMYSCVIYDADMSASALAINTALA